MKHRVRKSRADDNWYVYRGVYFTVDPSLKGRHGQYRVVKGMPGPTVMAATRRELIDIIDTFLA